MSIKEIIPPIKVLFLNHNGMMKILRETLTPIRIYFLS